MNKDAFGDRIKGYESTSRFMRQLPIIVRIDGKCFSKFTKGLQRPYDQGLIDLMIETTHYLVTQTNAKIGYTQSDEISLVLYEEDPQSQLIFDGKEQKLVSVLASMATGYFNKYRAAYLPNHKLHELAFFDCRAFQVPTKIEAANAILWRARRY